MGIVIKKKPKFQKKKIIKRIIILFLIYLLSFTASFLILNKKNLHKNEKEQPTVITYANDGEKFLAEKKYAAALEYYLKILDTDPENYVTMTKIGLAYKNLNQFDKAKFYLYKSYNIAPTYTDNYVIATEIYILQKNYDIAENMIDTMPTSNKNDFLKKANLLILLTNSEPDLEEKVIHLRRALVYLQKYDQNIYNAKINDLLDLYYKLAQIYISKGDITNAINLYKSVPKYKDNCKVRNILAIKYKNISDIDAINNITQAVNMAKTQEEKRLTKENLIDLKYYFEQKTNNEYLKIINGLLDILNESTILIDEKYSPLSITNEEFKYIKDKKKKVILPTLKFKIKNKTNKPISSIYIKAEIYFHHKKVLETKKECIIPSDITLNPNTETDLITINFENQIKKNKLPYYTVALSLSNDNMNWKLYRLYQSNEISK